MSTIQTMLPSDWGKYRPAELTIKLKSPEMETDWTNVNNERGHKGPVTLSKELGQESRQKGIENVAIKAQEGDRILRGAIKEKNIFGQIAHDRYMREGPKEITIDVIPKQGVYIDFRIYPPEIHVEARGVLPK